MQVIDWKRLKEIIPYSRQHVARLEQAGHFPRRVRLGQNRVGWHLSEIEDWIKSRPRQYLTDNSE